MAEKKATSEKGTPPEKDTAQILLKVPPSIKEKAQLQADLAYSYGWIKSPTLTQLYIWETDYYLDTGIKHFIESRRQSAHSKPEGEEARHG